MASTDHRRQVRIFLFSHGDVAEGRRLAAELIDSKLRKDPGIVSSRSSSGCWPTLAQEAMAAIQALISRINLTPHEEGGMAADLHGVLAQILLICEGTERKNARLAGGRSCSVPVSQVSVVAGGAQPSRVANTNGGRMSVSRRVRGRNWAP